MKETRIQNLTGGLTTHMADKTHFLNQTEITSSTKTVQSYLEAGE